MSAWTRIERRQMMLAEARQRVHLARTKRKPSARRDADIVEYEATITRLEAEIAAIRKESDGR